ncbi:MAG: sugar phosphate isomerase/epimerase [Gemmatimonadota bacterium]|nr:sugar phosphate isomerase/epimerase [Gemmatimonadota bacterium]
MALPGPHASFPGSPRLGIQLYAVRDALKQDFAGTLTALATIGYREVEFAGLHGQSAADGRALLDRLGLAAPSGHIGLDDLEQKFTSVVADAKALGHRWIVVPWLPEELRNVSGYTQVAERMSRLAPRLRRAGFTLGYHNHSFEFDRLGDGSTCGYDILLQGTAAAGVVMELDLFWIKQGGADAADYFRRFPGRFRLVHVKDMGADGSQVNVGDGVIPWPALLHTARRAGVEHFFLEHDEPRDQLAFARESYAYLSRQKF